MVVVTEEEDEMLWIVVTEEEDEILWIVVTEEEEQIEMRKNIKRKRYLQN